MLVDDGDELGDVFVAQVVAGLLQDGAHVVGVLRQEMTDRRLKARQYTRDNGEDMPEIANWRWGGASRRLRLWFRPDVPPRRPGTGARIPGRCRRGRG